MNQHPLTRDVLVRIFFFGAFGLIFYQLFLLASPFFTAALGATMLGMTFYPLHRRLLRKLRHPTWAALLSTVSVLLLAVLPLVGLGWFFIRETTELTPAAQRLLEEVRSRDWPTLLEHLPGFAQRGLNYVSNIFTRMNVDIRQVLLDNAQTIGAQATTWASQALKNIVVTLMNALILSVVLFFAFRDGESVLQWVLSLIPMQANHKQIVSKRIYETFRAVVIGSFLTSPLRALWP